MELGDKEKRKLMAAAELVDRGDMAVLQKILEFQDILEDFKEEIDEKLAQKDTKIEEHKENIYSEMSSKMGEMLAEISVIKGEVEKMVKNDHMEAVHAKIMADFDTKLKGFKSDLDSIRASIPEMPESFDPTDVLNRISEVESKIPKIEELGGDKIIEKINSSEEQIDKERIKGLEDEIKSLRKDILASRPLGGVRRVFQPHRDDFSSLTDGSTKTFKLSKEPLDVNTILVFGSDFPIILRPDVDFTVTAKTLTLTSAVQAPSQGATLLIQYYA